MNRILVVCPLEDEMNSLIEGLSERGYDYTSLTLGRLSGVSFSGKNMILAQGGLGKTTFGIRTQHLIDHLGGVDLVVCAGTAGGLSSSLSIGDVVVATATVEHDFRTAIFKKPLPRFDGHESSIGLLRNAEKFFEESFKVHFVPVASGDEGIVDAKRAEEVREATGAHAVAWEGAGGARACEFSGVPYLEIRGISDMADHEADEAFVKNLPSTMKNVAVVISELVRSV